ncbi:MAG: RNA 3'-phosphate cyclase [Calditrichaeota bacterium]|nr:RNA 3'-phosphate cyclase [Calditrichota bacterium]
MIRIDGSQKSGSGTIVRDAVPFAVLTGQSLHLFNIRARRKNPGLRAQHVTAIRACAQMCGGRLKGDAVGSSEIYFSPGDRIRGGHYRWDIGTAGSTIMLAMAVLPLALFAEAPSEFHIVGGVFQDFAPSAFHFQQLFLPLLRKMGIRVELEIVRPGYVPVGEGEIRLRVQPHGGPLRSLELLGSGHLENVRGIALSSHLRERRVSHRMADACLQELQKEGIAAKIERVYDEADDPAFRRPSVQPGAALAIWAQTSWNGYLGADMAGKPGRRAEWIGQQVARQLVADWKTGATVDRYLADQLIPYAAMAKGITRYRIPECTDHVDARLWLVEQFFQVSTRLEGKVLEIVGRG